LSGDVTMDNTGAVTIAAGAVESSMLANGAGVAALLTAGLGGSVSVTKTDADTHTVVAANGTKDRACLVLVVVDETYAIGTGTLPTVKIGEDDTIEKCMAGTVLDDEVAGTVLAFAFTNTATKKIIVTTTAAVGDATGGCSVTVLAIPTT
jgi:pectate lyase